MGGKVFLTVYFTFYTTKNQKMSKVNIFYTAGRGLLTCKSTDNLAAVWAKVQSTFTNPSTETHKLALESSQFREFDIENDVDLRTAMELAARDNNTRIQLMEKDQ